MKTVLKAARLLKFLIPLLIGLFFLKTIQPKENKNTNAVTSVVDHVGIIKSWDEESLLRGKKIYGNKCASCHGIDGLAVVASARSFRKDLLKTEGDPYQMWRVVKFGYGYMPPHGTYTPQEVYDVIHYIRETFIKPYNHNQYEEITEEYLNALEKEEHDDEFGAASIKAKRRPPDYGPVLSTISFKDTKTPVLIFKMNQGVFLNYDLERMRQVVLWEGTLNLSKTCHMDQMGERTPSADGRIIGGLQTYHWAFKDNFEPVPTAARSGEPAVQGLFEYHGHYLYQNRAILSFTTSGRKILEMPSVYKKGDFVVLEHTIQIGPGDSPLKLCVGQFDEGAVREGVFPLDSDAKIFLPNKKGAAKDNLIMSGDLQGGRVGRFIVSGLVGEAGDFEWEVDDQHRLGLHIPASNHRRTIRVLRYSGEGPADLIRFRRFIQQTKPNWRSKPVDLTAFLHGGPRRWSKIIKTKGLIERSWVRNKYLPWDASDIKEKRDQVRLTKHPAYVLDDLPLPDKNPWNAWMRTSALDFFSDGRIAVSTIGGDVWIVSGVDENLKGIQWQRYATGLSEPLGLKIINDVVYVTCRDGVIRLHDFNKNGEADFYESFYTAAEVGDLNFELKTDSAGDLYYATEGGTVIRISSDGKRSEVIANGFRVPFGMGMDAATDTVYVSDQEGEWVPASRISVIPRNSREMPWFGYSPTIEKIKDTFISPLLWMPKDFDNSSGGQLMVHDKRFGPLHGKLIHTSFGKGWLYYVMQEETHGVKQASVVAFPFQFNAGIHRAAVNPRDGQVYVVGLSGATQTETIEKDGCLSRIRYTGALAYLVMQTKVHSNGIQIDFSFDLDRRTAENIGNYRIEQWNYRWASQYGSEHWSVSDPDRVGHDAVLITSAKVLESGRSVFLAIPEIQPVQQMAIYLTDIKAADGTAISELIYLTINQVPHGPADQP